MKFDKRRKYYMILDCETATLPIASNYSADIHKKIAIAKPLIYDIGWQIVDRQGRIYARKSYLISEIFLVPQIFNTAYYAHKRPLYLEALKKGEITLKSWEEVAQELEEDLSVCHSVGAYNSMFDFKKAIPFTEEYIAHLFSPNYQTWEERQNFACEQIAQNSPPNKNPNFDGEHFEFRGNLYDLFDIWGLACEHLLNCDEYRKFCTDNNLYSSSGKYYSTNAENCYKFLKQNIDFVESHTAIADTEIETEIFCKIISKKITNLTLGLVYFPFRIVGKV